MTDFRRKAAGQKTLLGDENVPGRTVFAEEKGVFEGG